MINWDKYIWKNEYLSSKNTAPWRCGKCWSGTLQVVLSSFKASKDTSNSAKLQCNNEDCHARYSVNGLEFTYANGHEVSKVYFRIDEHRLYVTHFQPELHLFKLPDYLPIEIRERLIYSFNHFWYDLDACVNKIRQVLELLMISVGAQKSTLHQMIVEAEKELSPGLYNDLLALKNIGNEGSHFTKMSFEREDILTMFSVVVDVLNQFYPNSTDAEKRNEFIKRAIENKGIKSK